MIDDAKVAKDLDGLDNIDSFWDSARLGVCYLFRLAWRARARIIQAPRRRRARLLPVNACVLVPRSGMQQASALAYEVP